MDIGMLSPSLRWGMLSPMKRGTPWFDNDQKADLPAKIARAASYYRDKYGEAPNLCFIHPSMLDTANNLNQSKVEVRTSNTMLPNHFWIGINQPEKYYE